MIVFRCDRCGADGSKLYVIHAVQKEVANSLLQWEVCGGCLDAFGAWTRHVPSESLPQLSPAQAREVLAHLLGGVGYMHETDVVRMEACIQGQRILSQIGSEEAHGHTP